MDARAGKDSFTVDLGTTIDGDEYPSSDTDFLLPEGIIMREGSTSSLSKPDKGIFFAQGRIAQYGYLQPSLVEAHFIWFTNDCFGLVWLTLHSFSLFNRIGALEKAC